MGSIFQDNLGGKSKWVDRNAMVEAEQDIP